jgi:hypothetical protein
MTWEDWHSARQQIAEEFLGAPLREQIRREDAAVEATKAAIRSTMPKKTFPELAADAQTIAEQARLRTIQPRPITDEIVGG